MRVKYSNAHLSLFRQRCNLKEAYLNKRVLQPQESTSQCSVLMENCIIYVSVTLKEQSYKPGAHSECPVKKWNS
jgi:hypothetical protein